MVTPPRRRVSLRDIPWCQIGNFCMKREYAQSRFNIIEIDDCLTQCRLQVIDVPDEFAALLDESGDDVKQCFFRTGIDGLAHG